MTSDPELKAAYRRYNRLLFGNSLRPDVITCWDVLEKPHRLDAELSDEIVKGRFTLRIHEKFKEQKNQWVLLMIHEMAHLHVWPYDRHGEHYDREIERLTKYKSYRKLL
jgi:hypothetical protein